MIRLFLFLTLISACSSKPTATNSSSWMTVIDETGFPAASYRPEKDEVKFFVDKEKAFKTLMKFLIKQQQQKIQTIEKKEKEKK